MLLAASLCTVWITVPAADPAGASERYHGSLHILGAIPQGEFADNLDDPGFGIGGSFLARLPQSPLYIGGDLSFFIYGQSERTEPFNPNIPEVQIEVETSNNLLQGGLVLRLQPPTGHVRPYLDGYLGFNYLSTSTTIRDRGDSEEIASDTNQEDTAFAWGGGGGLKILLYKPAPEKGKLRGLYLDGRVRYLVGGEADYLKEGSIQRVGSRLTYDLYHSRTDVLQTGVGVTLEF